MHTGSNDGFPNNVSGCSLTTAWCVTYLIGRQFCASMLPSSYAEGSTPTSPAIDATGFLGPCCCLCSSPVYKHLSSSPFPSTKLLTTTPFPRDPLLSFTRRQQSTSSRPRTAPLRPTRPTRSFPTVPTRSLARSFPTDLTCSLAPSRPIRPARSLPIDPIRSLARSRPSCLIQSSARQMGCMFVCPI